MSKALPEKTPRPTYAPFFVSLGVFMIAWSLISSWFLAVAGVPVFAWGIYIWILNLLDEDE
jgi:hypothetical protein